jgi:DNA-3-methyladenine glycosylase II
MNSSNKIAKVKFRMPVGIVNPKSIKQLLSKDKIFKLIFDKYGSPPDWSRSQGFISLSKIILEQQVSLASANAHFLKLNSYLKEFSPSNIIRLTDKEMRNCQISRQKAVYLRALSNAIINEDLKMEVLGKLKEPEIRKQLTNIKGIGNWTTDIYLMFCLQSKDIFPIGDIAVVNTIKELTKVKSREDILKLSENWKPFRSLATYFLWHYYLSKRNRS